MSAVVPEGAADPAATPPQSVRLLNLPNALTMFRLAVVPLFAVLLLSEGGLDDDRRIWATLFFAGAIITDRYDGMIARRTNQVTEFGKLADPIADKALTGTALLGLSILGLLPWWVTVVILFREVGVTLLRFWVIRHGVIAASRGGKAKTVLQALAIGLYILPLSGLAGLGPLVGDGGGAGAHRHHRHRLRLPGTDPAPHQRPGACGPRRPGVPPAVTRPPGQTRRDTAA